ncbi:hypothetical protein GcM1_188001 [Golovinomyces cichoracearum]|uniref:Uncharacterized protein n=1 Tax=Golovinomyces cichoracearum TaxID=62708 RepID=A0A420J289_9PEZI|nr:hypothetical protein GcM1_188001 [Golovinomyces cichoracearum]
MTPIYRILVKTHHITSQKKIIALTAAAKTFSCSVLLKVGDPPGIMIAEGEDALQWLKAVKKLRYKDYCLRKKELVETSLLKLKPGQVLEFNSVKELASFLGAQGDLLEWWRVNMGYKKA